jgi:serine/threonine-protein kinase HipA
VTTIARVNLWGRQIGAVALEEGSSYARFQYAADFAQTAFELAPLMMPLSERPYSFPALPLQTFHGLPGLLSDTLPDKFGNLVINRWLAAQGRAPESFNAVERLCYTGTRGMGALEFAPVQGPRRNKTKRVALDALVELAADVLARYEGYAGHLDAEQQPGTLDDLLLVSTSAGGARAKALIAWNPDTHEVRSGQVDAGDGFGYWLLKFDGVGLNRDKERLTDPLGYGVIEYAYHQMAVAAKVEMAECRLLEENNRRHFMTRRFDRTVDGKKLHMQSLCAMAHYDFNAAGQYSYEQALLVIRQLGLRQDALQQLFRRMVFNVVARNQDDHTKQISFLMGQSGRWSLAPAYDVVYSYNPTGSWTSQHQMSINGKRDGFTRRDLIEAGKTALLKSAAVHDIIDEVTQAVRRWPEIAAEAGVPEVQALPIASTHRLMIA